MYTINLNEDFYSTFLLRYKNGRILLLKNALLENSVFEIIILLINSDIPLCLITLQLPKDSIPMLNKYDFTVFSFKEILETHGLSLNPKNFQVVSLNKELKALSSYHLGDKALLVNSSTSHTSSYVLQEYFLTDINQLNFTLE